MNTRRAVSGRCASKLIRVDAEVADVIAQRPQSNVRVLVKVALAELEHAAEGAQQRRLREIASPASEFKTTSTPAPPVACITSSANDERARIEDMIGAKQAHEIALGIASRGGENFRAQVFGELDRGNSHAAGGAVDQHPLPFAQARQFVQRVVGREECSGYRCRRGK